MSKRMTNMRGVVELHLEVPAEEHRLIRTVAAQLGRPVQGMAVPLIVEHFRAEAARLGIGQPQASADVAGAQ